MSYFATHQGLSAPKMIGRRWPYRPVKKRPRVHDNISINISSGGSTKLFAISSCFDVFAVTFGGKKYACYAKHNAHSFAWDVERKDKIPEVQGARLKAHRGCWPLSPGFRLVGYTDKMTLLAGGFWSLWISPYNTHKIYSESKHTSNRLSNRSFLQFMI